MQKTRKNRRYEPANIPPPFCRQGNKFPMREEIMRFIPPHNRYVEPFFGSGAIFYNKTPVAEENILNDLDKHTYDQHRLLLSAPTNPEKYPRGLKTIPNIKRFYRKTPRTPAERLIHAKIEACNGFSGSPVRLSYGIHRKADPTKILKNLTFYQSRLKTAKILNQDYAKVVETYDSPTTFFFFDPPYEKTRAIYGYGEHKEFDYSRLLDVLRSIRGKFLMTINDSPTMRNMFKEFNIKTTKVYARWSRKTKRAEDRNELLIMNYRVGRI
jgi:DNA adenine methylase